MFGDPRTLPKTHPNPSKGGSSDSQGVLGGGFKYFFFSPLFGQDSPFWPNIFQRGWFNHQLGTSANGHHTSHLWWLCHQEREIVIISAKVVFDTGVDSTDILWWWFSWFLSLWYIIWLCKDFMMMSLMMKMMMMTASKMIKFIDKTAFGSPTWRIQIEVFFQWVAVRHQPSTEVGFVLQSPPLHVFFGACRLFVLVAWFLSLWYSRRIVIYCDAVWVKCIRLCRLLVVLLCGRTLQGTITYPLPAGTWVDDIPFPVWWNMLVPRKVIFLIGLFSSNAMSKERLRNWHNKQGSIKISCGVHPTNQHFALFRPWNKTSQKRKEYT